MRGGMQQALGEAMHVAAVKDAREQKLRAIWDEVMADPNVPPHDIVFAFARRAYDAGVTSTLKI